MQQLTLEQRLASLESEVANLRAALAKGSPAKNWEDTVGMFTDDEVMKQIMQNALELRERDREKSQTTLQG